MSKVFHPVVRSALRLPYRRPFDWPAFLAFLAPRAIRGVESVGNGVYRRGVREGAGVAMVAVSDDPAAGMLVADVHASDPGLFAAVATRLRRFFDLDAEPEAIAGVLRADPLLAPMVEANPGRRVPGAMDGLEMLARAILGQQVSVAGARTLAGRIAERWGAPLAVCPGGGPDGFPMLLFPTADVLADVELESVGVMPSRARAIRAAAAALKDDPGLLDPLRPPAETVARLLDLPGIGPWTAQYVALRALRDPDAFPASDLGLLKAASPGGERLSPRALLARAEGWRPWRAYAAVHLWAM